MALTAPPTAPLRTMSQADFDAAVAARIAWDPVNVTELTALQLDVADKQATASNAATTATAQAGIATDKVALTAADAEQTALDRIQTGQDRTQTGLDRAAAEAAAATAGGAAAFIDSNPIIKGSVDATKQVRFEVDGLATATTRVITVPDKNGTLAMTSDIASLSGTAAGTIDLLTGASIASAATINLDAATGNRVHITGTTAITAVTLTRGPRTVIFDGILTLTHHATNNNLPGAANITTAAGDRAIYESDETNVYCVSYTRASGVSVVSSGGITIGAAIASTSGTSINFTGIPAGTKRITISLIEVSTSGTGNKLLQIGDSGGIENTTYLSNSVAFPGGAITQVNSTAGFAISSAVADHNISGSITLILENAAAFTWSAQGALAITGGANTVAIVAGKKSLSSELTMVRLTTVAGTDTFDFGEINIAYE